MISVQRLRMPLDITMTALSVILMGGTILFPDLECGYLLFAADYLSILVLFATTCCLPMRKFC